MLSERTASRSLLSKACPATSRTSRRAIVEVLTVDGLRIASIYLPNGNPVATPRSFAYKLAWMDRLDAPRRRAAGGLEEAFVLGGDYNVIPERPRRATTPSVWAGRRARSGWKPGTHFRTPAQPRPDRGLPRPASRAPGPIAIWDYQGGAWDERPRHPHRPPLALAAGRRPAARLRHRPRAAQSWTKASDHTPVVLRAAPPDGRRPKPARQRPCPSCRCTTTNPADPDRSSPGSPGALIAGLRGWSTSIQVSGHAGRGRRAWSIGLGVIPATLVGDGRPGATSTYLLVPPWA